MEIRQLHFEDIDANKDKSKDLQNLIEISMTHNFKDIEIDEYYYVEKVEDLKRYLSEEKATTFIAEENGIIIGFIWTCIIDRLSEKRLHIVHFAVHDDYNNMGIGSKLLSKVEDYARTIGIDFIDLFVSKCNDSGLFFYKNKNFDAERFLMRKKV